jgi:hypothetical protein
MLEPRLPLGANGLELFLVIVATAAAALYCFRTSAQEPRRRSSVWLVLALFILIAVAIEATQFLTVDAGVIVKQVLAPRDRGLSQWTLGAFHSGLIVLLVIAHVAQWLGADPITAAMSFKAAWWLIGILLFGWIALELEKAVAPKLPRSVAIIFVWCLLLLLPTDNLALKTINYDLLSTALSVAAIVIASRGIVENRSRLLYISVILASMATQEKLSASPILLVLIVAYATIETDVLPAHRLFRVMMRAAAAIGGALMVGVISSLLFAALGPAVLPPGFWMGAADPLFTWLFVPLYFLMKVTEFGPYRAQLLALSVAILIGASLIVAAVLPRLRNVLDNLQRRATPIAHLLLFLLFALGVLGILFVPGYWAPYHPADPSVVGRYSHFNGIIIHFDGHRIIQHMGRYFLYACAVVVAAMPSVIWLSLGIPSASRRLPWPIEAVVPLTIAMIGVAMLTNVPIAPRYLDIWLCGLVLVMAGRLVLWLEDRRWGAYALYVLIVLALIELFPFRPIYASFRPFWVHYADSQRAEPGRLNPSWMGWGEEDMLAGKEIELACASHGGALAGVECSRITLRPFSYHGTWLPGPTTIKLEPTYPVGDPAKMTKADYYIASRLSLIQTQKIPQITPDFVVAYRGYDQAWVYRGDRLLAAGYRWP